MGYYIETPENQGKAEQLQMLYGAELLEKAPESFQDAGEDRVLIVVVENEAFDAAGIVYDEREFREFTRAEEQRPRHFLYMPIEKVIELCPKSIRVLK